MTLLNPSPFKQLSNEALISKTEALCAEERRITLDILLHLQAIEMRMVYAELGYSSLFEFAVKQLKYSKGSAGRRIAAMRLLKETPEFGPAVQSGELSVTVVSMAKHATQGKSLEEKKQVLELLKDQSEQKAERTLATLYPENVAPRERARAVSETHTQITFQADQALMEKLERLRNFYSHKNPNPSYLELFHLMADQLLKKLDPEQQRPRIREARDTEMTIHAARTCSALAREPAQPDHSGSPVPDPAGSAVPPNPVNSPGSEPPPDLALDSRYVSREIRRKLWKESGGRCMYRDPKTGRRCVSRHLLQVDHVFPYALGGKTEFSNLQILCRAHNTYQARKFRLRRPQSPINI